MVRIVNRRKRVVILHVGTHKTGTSYLQRLFLLSRKLLHSESIHYPSPAHEELGDHHLLVSWLNDGLHGWERFFSALVSDCDYTLVSSETLLTWLMTSASANEFAQQLTNFAEVRVVIYIRRQDFMKESVFAEVATSWYRGSIMEENHYRYNYGYFTDQLISLFGIDSLRLGIYRDDVKTSLSADFFRLCGLSHIAQSLPSIPPQRVSLDRRIVALMAPFPKDDPIIVDRLRRAALVALRPDSCKYLLSPQERRCFLERFLPSNRELARSLRPDAECYLVGDEDIPEVWTPLELFSLDELTELTRLLLLPDTA